MSSSGHQTVDMVGNIFNFISKNLRIMYINYWPRTSYEVVSSVCDVDVWLKARFWNWLTTLWFPCVVGVGAREREIGLKMSTLTTFPDISTPASWRQWMSLWFSNGLVATWILQNGTEPRLPRQFFIWDLYWVLNSFRGKINHQSRQGSVAISKQRPVTTMLLRGWFSETLCVRT